MRKSGTQLQKLERIERKSAEREELIRKGVMFEGSEEGYSPQALKKELSNQRNRARLEKIKSSFISGAKKLLSGRATYRQGRSTNANYRVQVPRTNLEPYRQDKERFIREARISERRSLFFDE